MANFGTERVLSVHHWNDSLFTFTTTREAACVSRTAIS